MVTIVKQYQVSPMPGTVSETSLHLTFFDLACLHLFPIQPLLLFESPLSKDHFAQLFIPRLKHSLSLALKHFFPLAGNLVFPPNSSNPEIRYKDGDSVTLIFAESGDDFYHFESNHHAKYSSDFHALVPQPSPGSMSNGMLVYPLMAIQVTHFPNQGICVAFTIHHVAADGRPVSNFVKTWCAIMASGGKETNIPQQLFPSYDRSTLVGASKGFELETAYWNQLKHKKFGDQLPTIPKDNVRATFVMSTANVELLKKHVTALCGPSSLAYISSFTITCGYAWSCIAKARAASGEEVGKDEDEEYFVIPADGRARITPPLPSNYFGNCLVHSIAREKSRNLVGEGGFVIATKIIGDAIHEKLHNEAGDEAGVLKDAMDRISLFEALKGKRVCGAVSSPRFGSNTMDFGWGRCKRFDMMNIDYSGLMSLNDSADGEGVTGIGLALPKAQMEAFASIWAIGFKETARLRCLL